MDKLINEHLEAAIEYAASQCGDASLTYTDLFAHSGLNTPQWYFENGQRLFVTNFMAAFHNECIRQDLPPFDAFIVNAPGGERAGYPGTGYFTINDLGDPLNENTSDRAAAAAFAHRERELTQIRDWRDEHDGEN